MELALENVLYRAIHSHTIFIYDGPFIIVYPKHNTIWQELIRFGSLLNVLKKSYLTDVRETSTAFFIEIIQEIHTFQGILGNDIIHL